MMRRNAHREVYEDSVLEKMGKSKGEEMNYCPYNIFR